MSPTDDRGHVTEAGLAALFALMAILVAIDLVTDLRGGTAGFHVVLEAAVVVIGMVAASMLALRMRRMSRNARELRDQASELAASLHASQLDAAKWRSDASALIDGLSAAIDQQFTRWELSPAEREIALLLLKGLSHKEIAQIRTVNETTVRQQSRTIYRKAGLSGRNDLAAFFLEDLLGPRARVAPTTTPRP